MSFLKNILGTFVEFKEEDKAGQLTQRQDNKGQNKSISTDASNGDSVSSGIRQDSSNNDSSVSGNATSPTQYQKHFQELIEEANNKNPLFQGTDFKEFTDSKSDVEGIADEATRYRTAFNVLKRTGLTKDKLVTTGREYLNVIDRDVKAFESVYLDQYKTQVERKEQQLQQKAQELQALTEKIEALNKEMKQMSQEIITSKDRLNSNKNSFISAGENIKKEIETELKKIDEYFS
ncbi:MAG: hypothetical protein JWQ09_363 [Segetibacter sp.]|nr:hypothetical protein [Segetibacter sp.]